MTDLSGMIRWNANFVRGLAESVLNRAKVIRTSLTAGTENEAVKSGTARSAAAKAPVGKMKPAALKKAAVKRATSKARTKRSEN